MPESIYDVFFIEVGIVKPTIVRVIARMDVSYELAQTVTEECLAHSEHPELRSDIIVETFNDDYDFTITIKPVGEDMYQSYIEKKILDLGTN